jgi:hypothetical protein
MAVTGAGVGPPTPDEFVLPETAIGAETQKVLAPEPEKPVDNAIGQPTESMVSLLVAKDFWQAVNETKVTTEGIPKVLTALESFSTPDALAVLTSALVGVISSDLPVGSWNMLAYDLTLRLQTELLAKGLMSQQVVEEP